MSDDDAGLRGFLNFQPGENYKSLVSAVFAVSPAFGNGRIEEFGKHPIRIGGLIRRFAHFEQAGALEFSETFQFATGKTGQEIEN